MASLLNSTNYLVYDLPTDQQTGTWSSDGTTDPSYPLTNIDDNKPWNPCKFTANPTQLVMDFGSAKRIDLVSFIHCNFDSATIHVQMNATNVWTTPSVDRTVTVPAATEDGMPANPWCDVTADPNYLAGGYRFLRITTANTALLSIGDIRLTAVLRQLPGNLQWQAHDIQSLPALEFATEGSVQLGYRLGVRPRRLTGQFQNVTDATFTALQSWYRAAGRTLPTLLIVDPRVNEAWFVKWGNAPTWLFDRSYMFENIHALPAAWDEVGRGLKP